jgi:hypothetical protein
MKVIKKCLTLVAMMFSLASFANSTVKVEIPVWDKPLQTVKVVRVFANPYVTNYGGYILGSFPNRTLQLQVSLDHSCPVKWLVTLQVFGLWNSAPGGASYKAFDVIFNSGQWTKNLNISLALNEDAYTSMIDELYEGPY